MKEDYNEFNEEESGDENVHKGHILDIEDNEEEEKKDQDRTRATKKKFIKLFPRCSLVVSITCKEVGIAQKTFYRWYDQDGDFAKAIDKEREATNDMVNDLLIEKIKEKETRAITYYLDRRHPLFKPTSKTEVVTGSKTLEDILKGDETNENGDNTKGGVGDEGGKEGEGSTIPAGESVQDKKQEGAAPTV